MSETRLILGEALTTLRGMESASVDAVVTDPPAGIAFMGKEWDSFPAGGRGVCRKTGNGQPCESHGFAKDVHWQNGAEPRRRFIAFLTERLAECLRVAKPGARLLCWAIPRTSHWTGTAIEDAGWIIEDRISHLFGQGFPKAKSKLKPACEDWWLARKASRTVPELNIDACRIPTDDSLGGGANNGPSVPGKHPGWARPWMSDEEAVKASAAKSRESTAIAEALGRWPAHLILDEEAAAMLDEQSGESKSSATASGGTCPGPMGWGQPRKDGHIVKGHTDSGGASRFFYCPKASKADRGAGNTHPTVKSQSLMRWLVRLITPKGGKVLDPFAGSATTLLAAMAEGFDADGIEQNPEYHAMGQKRLDEARGPLFAEVV